MVQKKKSYFNRLYIDLLSAMTEKEIKVRYKHAVLGFLWMFLNPLFQMLVIGIVFQFITKVPIDNYFLYLFLGLLVWNFFSFTLSRNTTIIVQERSLIQKANFPREILVLSGVLANGFHLLVSLVLLVPVLVFLGEFHWSWFWILPAGLIWLLGFTTGLSLLTAALNVRFRDMTFIIQAGLPLWFYATPVVYPLSFVPEWLRGWFYLNPVTGMVELMHGMLGQENFNWIGLGVSLVISMVVCFLGYEVFRKSCEEFVDWV